MHNITADIQAFRAEHDSARVSLSTHPCGAPVSIAGPLHTVECITCLRAAWTDHPYTTPELEAHPDRGRPIITTPRTDAA